MHLPPDFIEDVKNRLNASDVIGKHVKLAHKSGGEFLGLCPFHKEKTPSFTVSNSKGFYHCFSCGAHGNIFNFTMEIEGKNFIEAVTSLAETAGLPMPVMSKHEAQQTQQRNSLYDLMEKACAWYIRQLHQTDNPAVHYLAQRNLSDDTQHTFRLGYAPEGYERLKQTMIAEGFTEKQLIDTGLIIKPEQKNKKSYDRFRDRLMFPICDGKGRVIAFGGRILGDGQPKYLNSPETPLFHKGNVLYNLHLAQEKAYRKKALVAVEGYMDAIAMYQAGIHNVVAPLGTALTDAHIQAMWRMAPEPVICLDGDNAGKRAMERAATTHLHLLKPGYSLNFCTLPQGQDPDDLINTQGVAALRSLLTSPTTLSQALWKKMLLTHTGNTPEQRALLESSLMQLTEDIKDSTVQYNYKDFFRKQLRDLKRQENNAAYTRQNYTNKNASTPAAGPAHHLIANLVAHPTDTLTLKNIESTILRTILNHPTLIQSTDMHNSFMQLAFSYEPYQNLYDTLCDIFDTIDETAITREILQKQLLSKDFSAILNTLLNGSFYDPFTDHTANPSDVKNGWEYSLYHHEFLQVTKEYEQYIALSTKDNDTILDGLLERQSELEKCVNESRNNYMFALDD